MGGDVDSQTRDKKKLEKSRVNLQSARGVVRLQSPSKLGNDYSGNVDARGVESSMSATVSSVCSGGSSRMM